jgi:pilus assembly protein Flp/PilA
MNQLQSRFRLSLSREEGQTLTEYALILALIALLVVGAIFFLRTQITDLFSNIGNNI